MAQGNNILLICDDEEISRYLRETLIIDGGCSVSFESSSQAGLARLRENNFDLVIAKFAMPDLDGFELVRSIKKIDPDSVIIVVFTEEPMHQTLKEVSKLGVYDFINKPFNLDKIFFLVKKGTELHSFSMANRKFIHSLQEQNMSLQKQNNLLAKRIEESTKNLTRLYEDLRQTYMRTIKALAQAIDARDHYTHSHSENVARYATFISEEMKLSAKDIELIREACELHDLGKIGVDDSILMKASSLNEQEWEAIKKHPAIGAQILEPLTFLGGVTEIIRQHHEHYDGLGYPAGLKGEEILLGARIIHLADAYDAMCSARSYRQVPFSKEEATAEIERNSGTQFDPKVVAAFLRVVDKF